MFLPDHLPEGYGIALTTLLARWARRMQASALTTARLPKAKQDGFRLRRAYTTLRLSAALAGAPQGCQGYPSDRLKALSGCA